MFKFEEYENLVNIAKERAYSSLKHFFELLDIDKSIYEYLTQVPICIDEERKITSCAAYVHGSDKIHNKILMGMKYLEDNINKIKNDEKQEAIKSVTITILHELLHANRDIIIKDGITYDSIDVDSAEEMIHEKLNIEKYSHILDEMIQNGMFDLFDNIVPLAIIPENNEAMVVAYDKNKKSFLFYDKQKYGLNGKITFLNVGLELNSNIEHKVSISIPEVRHYFNGELYDASDYYHQQHIDSSMKYSDDAKLRSKYQIELEENIIETIAYLIYSSRKNSSINLESHVQRYQNNGRPIEEALAAGIIRRMGIDTLKWFILSTHEEEYDDKLYKAYQEKYTDLLLIFNELRNDTLHSREQSDDSIDDAIDIINEKTP